MQKIVMIGMLLIGVSLYANEYGYSSDKNVCDTHKKSCNNGSLKDCYELGHCYVDGDIVTQKSLMLWDKACAGGISEACYYLGSSYENGMGVEKDEVTALELYKKSCKDDFPHGCNAYKGLYDTLGSTQVSSNEEILQICAESVQSYTAILSSPKSLCLFNTYQKRGAERIAIEKQEAECKEQVKVKKSKLTDAALRYCTASCEDRNIQGCVNLEGFYKTLGDYNNANLVRNYSWQLREEFCQSGDPAMCADIGGDLLIRDQFVKAKGYFIKACDKNIAKGCFGLGILYSRGLGVRQNYEKALEELGKGCDLGNQDACKEYARINYR